MFKWFRKKNDPENQAYQESPEGAGPGQDGGEAQAAQPSPGLESEESAGEPQLTADGPDGASAAEPEAVQQETVEDESPAAALTGAAGPQAPEPDQSATDQTDEAGRDEEEAAAPGETPADAGEDETESGPEPKRKGFFARLFSAKPEDQPEAEKTPADDQADAADVDAFLETVAAEDELIETALAAEESGEEAVAETVAAEEKEAVFQEGVESEAQEAAAPESAVVAAEAAAEAETEPRKGLFAKFKDKLSATRNKLAGRIETLLSSVRSIDDDVLDELEELLITADLGVKTTGDLLFKIRGQVAASELRDTEALKQALKKRMNEMLSVPLKPMPRAKPLVIMVVGINGVGKTTTIAKLTKRIQAEGQTVLLAAGDTFRSAAVEQLTVWAERLGADIVSQPTGSKSSAVTFDAISAAQTRGRDVVIIDTAGRLHTKVNLMDELKKIKRVAGKAMDGAPHHTILVLDGNTGQNALLQAQAFQEAVGVDSIIMTKLDGTAKGGVIVSIANELKIPITHIGLGESFDDLQPFDPEAFTEAILS